VIILLLALGYSPCRRRNRDTAELGQLPRESKRELVVKEVKNDDVVGMVPVLTASFHSHEYIDAAELTALAQQCLEQNLAHEACFCGNKVK
jgi:hypothetical protein